MCAAFKIMEALIHEKQFKNTRIIQPGSVGSVGDVLGSVRLKHSAPDLPLRFDPVFSGERESRIGSYVQDGMNGGCPAYTKDSNWGGGRDFKTQYGWKKQDLRVEDRRFEALMGEMPRYSWNNKIATVYEAKRRGEMFLPLPGEYRLMPGEVPRGGMTPRLMYTSSTYESRKNLIRPLTRSVVG